MDRWHRVLDSLPCRALLMDLVLMASILPRLVVRTGDGSTSVIRVDERNQQSSLMQWPLMPQVHVEPLMPAEQQQAADDEVNADLAPGQWPLMPGLAVIHKQQQAADVEFWTPW